MAGFWNGVLTFLNNPVEIFKQIISRFQNLAEVNYKIGCLQAARGDVGDAIVRFKIATWVDPTYYRAWYNMGCCLLAQNKREKAIDAFKKCLLIQKNHPDSLYMLASIDPRLVPANLQPSAMPHELAVSHFDALAVDYNEVQLNYYHYQGHLALHHMVQTNLGSTLADLQILDLGCGTGFCGPVFRPMAQALVGVDISPEMLLRASLLRDSNGRPIYDALRKDDLRNFLLQYQGEGYDMIISANSLNYLGDLTQVFDGAQRALKTRGYFAFSTDILRDPGIDYQMQPRVARFAHSSDYLLKQAARVGFIELRHEEIRGYPDYLMQQVLFQKP